MRNLLQDWLQFKHAQLLTLLGMQDRAIARLRALVGRSPDYAAAWRYVGFLHAQRGQDADAIEALGRALQLDAADDDTRFNHGFILHQAGRLEEAIAEFERVIKTSPGNDRAWYGLGLCRFARAELEQSVEALKEAARLQYFNPHAGFHLAVAYHKLGRHEEAKAEYERVKSFEPKFAEQLRRETGIA